MRIIYKFQFLIGTVLHIFIMTEEMIYKYVSIPYRYGITFQKEFIIILAKTYIVSIPYRYGITQS